MDISHTRETWAVRMFLQLEVTSVCCEGLGLCKTAEVPQKRVSPFGYLCVVFFILNKIIT